MSGNCWLSAAQFNKIKPLLPNKSRGVPRIDDRCVLSGIIFCLKRGYRWSDVPAEYGPAKTLYNRYKRWAQAGVFQRIFETLARDETDPSVLMIDASHVKTHRIAANGVKKTSTTTVSAHLPMPRNLLRSSTYRRNRHLVLMSLCPRAFCI